MTMQVAPVERDRQWSIVLGCALAMLVGNGPIVLFTFGTLLKPISAEFHWPRSELSSALAMAHLVSAIAMPFIGVMVDRWGARRVSVPAILLFSATMAIGSRLGDSRTQFLVLYALLGLTGSGHSTLTYARCISSWFDAKRGLALGLALAGVGLGTAIIPGISLRVIGAHGWRIDYLVLAALPVCIGLPSVLLLMRDPPRPTMATADAGDELIAGHSLGQALRGYRFWTIGFALLIVAAAINGSIAHIVPMLSDRGVSAAIATSALGASGIALILGRILSGLALDRFHAAFVSVLCFALPLVGMTMLGLGAGGVAAIVAAFLLGLGIGAEVDIMAFLAGRYFGMRHYGLIYGTLLSFFTLGSGLGPWIMALSFDRLGSYEAGMITLAGAMVIAIILLCLLGSYTYPPVRHGSSGPNGTRGERADNIDFAVPLVP